MNEVFSFLKGVRFSPADYKYRCQKFYTGRKKPCVSEGYNLTNQIKMEMIGKITNNATNNAVEHDGFSVFI